MEKKSTSDSSSVFDGKITRYDDLKDEFDETHIRGADNVFNEAIMKLREKKSAEYKEGMTRNHVSETRCPCGSLEVVKAGRKKMKNPDGSVSSVQQFLCKKCGRRFILASTGGLRRTRLSLPILVKLIKCMENDETYKTTASMLLINKKTAVYWRKVLFYVANQYMSTVRLRDRVYLDEKYAKSNDPEVLKGIRLRDTLSGLSKDQECIELAMDNHNNFLGIVYEKRGKVSKTELLESFHHRIEYGSTLIHDGDKSHRDLVIFGMMKSEEYVISKNKEEALRRMKMINNLCGYIENKLRKHTGIKSKNLQDYINWFLFLRKMKQTYCKRKNPDGAYHVIAHMIVATLSKVRFSDISRHKKVKESAK